MTWPRPHGTLAPPSLASRRRKTASTWQRIGFFLLHFKEVYLARMLSPVQRILQTSGVRCPRLQPGNLQSMLGTWVVDQMFKSSPVRPSDPQKFVEHQRGCSRSQRLFALTATVSSTFRTQCHQPRGINTTSPASQMVSIVYSPLS